MSREAHIFWSEYSVSEYQKRIYFDKQCQKISKTNDSNDAIRCHFSLQMFHTVCRQKAKNIGLLWLWCHNTQSPYSSCRILSWTAVCQWCDSIKSICYMYSLMPLSHSDATLMPLSQFEPHSLPVFGQAQLMNRFVGGNVRVTVTWVAGHRHHSHHTSFKSFNSYLGSAQGHLRLALATCTAEVRGANAVNMEPCGCRPLFQWKRKPSKDVSSLHEIHEIIKRDQNFFTKTSGFGLSVKALMRRSMVSLATVCRHVENLQKTQGLGRLSFSAAWQFGILQTQSDSAKTQIAFAGCLFGAIRAPKFLRNPSLDIAAQQVVRRWVWTSFFECQHD